MDPYAKPKERNIGARRPKIRHVSQSVQPRTRRERQAEKQGVAAERRAIKKAARQIFTPRLADIFSSASAIGLRLEFLTQMNRTFMR